MCVILLKESDSACSLVKFPSSSGTSSRKFSESERDSNRVSCVTGNGKHVISLSPRSSEIRAVRAEIRDLTVDTLLVFNRKCVSWESFTTLDGTEKSSLSERSLVCRQADKHASKQVGDRQAGERSGKAGNIDNPDQGGITCVKTVVETLVGRAKQMGGSVASQRCTIGQLADNLWHFDNTATRHIPGPQHNC